MTKNELRGIWNYYLSLEKDIDNTSRYIEPEGQENVYSFEFAKILILSCTEIESVLKMLCFEISGENVGDIGRYKELIMGHYPQISEAEVVVKRWGKTIAPFEEWKTGKLTWWDAYQAVKHSRGGHFQEATYKNAVTALSALYLLIFYLAKVVGIYFRNCQSEYIESEYSDSFVLCNPTAPLPGFEEGFVGADPEWFKNEPD